MLPRKIFVHSHADGVYPLHWTETIEAHDQQYHGTYMDGLLRAPSGEHHTLTVTFSRLENLG
jgi:hypothetical protein